MKTPVNQLVQTIRGLAGSGCRLACLTYESKGSGEIARHTIALGVSLENAYRKDLATLEGKRPALEGIKAVACDEMIASLKNSLEKGIGENDNYTNKDTYIHIAPGVKLHEEAGKLHIYGFTVRKETIVEGTFKKVDSNAKTLAKKELQKGLKTSKFRQFAVDSLEVAALQGKRLVFA